MKVFKKLVRDRIPEIMILDGKKPVTRILDQTEFVVALGNKLLEEVQEFRTDPDVGHRKMELADIYEVLDEIIQAIGLGSQVVVVGVAAEAFPSPTETAAFWCPASLTRVAVFS